MNMIWLLVWFVVIPEQGVRYYHLGTHDNETLCLSALKDATIMVNENNETIECIGVNTDD